jgi:3-phenylpropionate/cinnamic acid dioxygenase small subunit
MPESKPLTQIEKLILRIDRLESRASIRELISDYCLGFDNRDWDRFISVWHPDAIWEIPPPFGTYKSHEEIRQAVFGIFYPEWRETHHLATNLRLTFEDDDHAHGICNVDCMGATVDGVVKMIGTSFFDDFERREGSWKIAKHSIVIHYFNDIPNAIMTSPSDTAQSGTQD